MAGDNAIYAVAKTILGLIEDYCPDTFNAEFFDFYHADDYRTAPEKRGFSLMLYRVGINASLRNLPPRRDENGRRVKPSLPLDLHYMLTPWASSADTQQLMLGWVMRFLEDRQVIPAAIVNSYAAGALRPDEAIEFVCDPLAATDYFNLWEKLKPGMQTSVTYVARMVLLDSKLQVDEALPVQTREFEVGIEVPQ